MMPLAIAKRDIAGFFATLRGPAILWFFLLFTGIFFWSFVNTFLEFQNSPQATDAPSLEQLIAAVFQNIQFILMLVIPAVTMSAFSEERQAKTFRLLRSAPLTSWQIVAGKMIGGCAIIALVILATIPLIGYAMIYGNPDPGPILTSYFGLMLLMVAQVAFGVFISAITHHQFLSFVFTLCGLFFSMILSWIARSLTQNDVGQSLMRYLSTTHHLDPLLKGLVSVYDVAYFVLLAAAFVLLTVYAIDAEDAR